MKRTRDICMCWHHIHSCIHVL